MTDTEAREGAHNVGEEAAAAVDVRRDATRAVVDNLGLIWPDEAEAMHSEVADAVLAAVRDHLYAHLDRAIGDAAGIYDLDDDEVRDIVNRVLPPTGGVA